MQQMKLKYTLFHMLFPQQKFYKEHIFKILHSAKCSFPVMSVESSVIPNYDSESQI